MKLNAPNALADCRPNDKPIMDDDAYKLRLDRIEQERKELHHKAACFDELVSTLQDAGSTLNHTLIWVRLDSKDEALVKASINTVKTALRKAKGGKA